ncbi:gamma-glutamyltransferase [Planktotalea frisia]|uniref:gamma-glutamyltransferase n=1 Tax=Planktotalea frisia TaxID=696762 RepID=UPI002357A9B8|nr:gamma-glutamyltransferase [Planktotalea frisia]
MRQKLISTGLALIAPFALFAQEAADAVQPETTISLNSKAAGTPVEAQDWMIVAANPLASQAGAKVLRRGGTAADAMIAVQTVLGLVEPQSSGLGGGAFLVWYDAESGALTTLDGRETAPADATPRLFQDENGEPLKFWDAVVGGRSVGVPGTPALMERAHQKWGNQKWDTLFEDGIALAAGGFKVSERLAGMIARDSDRLVRFGGSSAYFYPAGVPLKEGKTLRNPDYAETLRDLAKNRTMNFYNGDIAREIVRTVRNTSGNPGVLSMADMRGYEVKERASVCAAYRAHEVCGMGPPSSGALTVGQILGMLDGYDLAALGAENPQSWRLIGDASRLAFADRGRYMADSDFVPVPVKGLVDPEYLAQRAEALDGGPALETVSAGMPAFDHAMLWADDESIELPSTSHISIVDSYGNALSMTTTIENAFGSRLMVRGFLLNNELTDFSFRTHKEGVPIANAVAPGKRPRSSMAPTIVLKDGRPVLVVGSPGGSRIIGYVAKTIVAHLDWGMDVQQAVSLGHAVNRFGTYDLEAGSAMEAMAPELEALGYKVKIRDLNSGINAISIGDSLLGGADPRREGVALGE